MAASCPARKCSPSFDRPCGPSPASTGVPSVPRSDRWMWQELPSRSFGLAMNVMLMPVLRRDLLRAGLVDRVVVAGGEHVGVAERDLVLAEVALALGRLDVHAGAGHAVAEPPQQRLDPGGAEDRVVHVVVVGGDEVPVVLRRRPARSCRRRRRTPARCRPARPGRARPAGSTCCRRICRGRLDHRRAVQPGQVGHHQRGAGMPGDPAQRGHVRPHDEVAVAAFPGRDLVAVDGVHVHVDGEQVVAALGEAPAAPRRGRTRRTAACPAAGPACR